MYRETGNGPECGKGQSGHYSKHPAECRSSQYHSRHLENTVKDRSYEYAVSEKEKDTVENSQIPVITSVNVMTHTLSCNLGNLEICRPPQPVPGI